MAKLQTGHAFGTVEFAYFASAMAALNPRGFRKHAKRRGSSTLVERAFVACGMMKPSQPDVSERGKKRAARRKAHAQNVRIDQALGRENRATRRGLRLQKRARHV